MAYTIEEINDWLKEKLDEERYEHSIGTAECAKELALKFGVDPEKAYFAGLIHDCAKCMPREEMDDLLHFAQLEKGEFENPKTHHAPVGVYIAQKELGVDDEEILSAIRWHTIGKLDMSLFDMIIFLADKIEVKTRPAEIREPITKILEEGGGLKEALLLCYKNTIKSLVDRDLTICTPTIDIYNELIKHLKIDYTL